MIKSEILQEKYRIQIQLSAETPSISDYLFRTQQDAKAIATLYGLQLHYAELIFMLPNDESDEALNLEAVV